MFITEVGKGGIETALKKLKRKWDNSKAIFELRDRQAYTKPSETKRLFLESITRDSGVKKLVPSVILVTY